MAAGVEFSDLNWLGIAIMVVVNMGLGFLWYAPFTPTGRMWMKGTGVPADFKPARSLMIRSTVLAVVGAFLVMFVLDHTFIAYRDAYRLDGERLKGGATGGLTIVDGLTGGFMTWLGFFVPVLFASVSWENKPWSLFFVNAGYYLVTLLLAGVVLTTVGV